MDDIERIIESARLHGEDSEPDHEVGDLQDALRQAWLMMTPAQRRQLIARFFQLHVEWTE